MIKHYLCIRNCYTQQRYFAKGELVEVDEKVKMPEHFKCLDVGKVETTKETTQTATKKGKK